jgi:hypothetical protein
MDKRIIIIAALTVLAGILTIVRESGSPGGDSFSLLSSPKKQITGEQIHRMADTTLKALGIRKENIRPIRNRNDVRVFMPPSFDPLQFVKAMNDSLEEYEAQIVSMENAREKTSVVQVKNGETILKSYIFSKEQATAARKGASPSVPKKQTR